MLRIDQTSVIILGDGTQGAPTRVGLEAQRALVERCDGRLVTDAAAVRRHRFVMFETSATDEEVYRMYADDLTRYATALVGPHDASDVVTDAVLAAFRSPHWAEVENRRAYLYRCVANRARDHHRSTGRRRRRELEGGLRLVEQSSTPEPALEALEALATLSTQQRSIAYLAYWEDLTAQQIAERLNMSTGSVKKQLARARAQLRKVIHHD